MAAAAAAKIADREAAKLKDGRLPGPGRCYEDAFHYVQSHPGATLVHGVAWPNNPKLGGLGFRHAWAEDGPKVFDSWNGYTKRGDFYKANRPTERRKYTLKETYRQMSKEKTYGPWGLGYDPNGIVIRGEKAIFERLRAEIKKREGATGRKSASSGGTTQSSISGGGGGEVQVSSYERSNGQVRSYTRSRPGKG